MDGTIFLPLKAGKKTHALILQDACLDVVERDGRCVTSEDAVPKQVATSEILPPSMWKTSSPCSRTATDNLTPKHCLIN